MLSESKKRALRDNARAELRTSGAPDEVAAKVMRSLERMFVKLDKQGVTDDDVAEVSVFRMGESPNGTDDIAAELLAAFSSDDHAATIDRFTEIIEQSAEAFRAFCEIEPYALGPMQAYTENPMVRLGAIILSATTNAMRDHLAAHAAEAHGDPVRCPHGDRCPINVDPESAMQGVRTFLDFLLEPVPDDEGDGEGDAPANEDESEFDRAVRTYLESRL